MKAYAELQMCPFLTSALSGCEGSASHFGLLCSQENTSRYPFRRSLGGPQSRSGRFWCREKSIGPAGNRVKFWEPNLKISRNVSSCYVSYCSPYITVSFEIEKLLFKLSYNAKIESQHIEHADGFQSSFPENVTLIILLACLRHCLHEAKHWRSVHSNR
jgi:hypothetical protein